MAKNGGKKSYHKMSANRISEYMYNVFNTGLCICRVYAMVI